MDRREEIIAAAVRLFEEKGYASTSMQDIADAVGLLKGSLYHHITGKEELLYEIHERFMAVILEKAAAREVAQGLSSRQRLEAIITDLLELIRDYRAYVEVFFRSRYNLQGPRWEAIHAKRERYEGIVRAIVLQGQQDGSFRADLDYKVVSFGLFGMCNWCYQWMQPDGKYNALEVARMFTTLLLDGLGTPQTRSAAQVANVAVMTP
ncbi:MAG: TetR/AcrR family transcriptional regulator [Chloroflexales bacterium]|nr:TetR/AcrR family transcriptional regulator [Chloroflexales bacterium]